MALFYTHVLNDTSFTTDEEGGEFPDLAAATKRAKVTIGAIIAEELGSGREMINLTLMIDDADHVRVGNLRAVTRLVSSISPFAD